MRESKKFFGILGIFLFVFLGTGFARPDVFFQPFNLENLVRWTALYGILSIGVVFPILTGGIDLSIGSVVGLVGTLLPWLLVSHGWSVGSAIVAVLLLSCLLGLFHGLLITRLGLQPFVVTLCGLLLYRGIARWLTDDQTQGFGSSYEGLRALATGRPLSMAWVLVATGAAAGLSGALSWRRRKRSGERYGGAVAFVVFGGALALSGLALMLQGGEGLGSLRAPTPFLFLIVLGVAAHLLLGRTVFGRYLFAVGRNDEAARYAGIRTDRVLIGAYVLCSGLAGLGGVLFALDINSVQPASHGNFYELWAIAAAVLGGCSLRGGEGSIAGVVVGAAVMRVIYNSINLLEIPTTLIFAIVGAVLLLGVSADELVRRTLQRRARRPAG